jgi:hypothetical protein
MKFVLFYFSFEIVNFCKYSNHTYYPYGSISTKNAFVGQIKSEVLNCDEKEKDDNIKMQTNIIRSSSNKMFQEHNVKNPSLIHFYKASICIFCGGVGSIEIPYLTPNSPPLLTTNSPLLCSRCYSAAKLKTPSFFFSQKFLTKPPLNSVNLIKSSPSILPPYAIITRLRNAEMLFFLVKKKCLDCMLLWSGVIIYFSYFSFFKQFYFIS